MSELKEHLFVPYSELQQGDELTDAITIAKSYYLKSEVDKVIAKLENENERLKKQSSCTFSDDCLRVRLLKADYKEACDRLQTANLIKDEQLAATRHSKRKRCLAMAKWCEERYNYLTCLENWQMTDKEYQQAIGDYWDRWNTRWLKIAEKFKDKEA